MLVLLTALLARARQCVSKPLKEDTKAWCSAGTGGFSTGGGGAAT